MMKNVIAVAACFCFLLTGVPLLAQSDAEKGEKAFQYGCILCHEVGKDRKGPNLSGAAGRWSKEDMVALIVAPEQHRKDPRVTTLYRQYKKNMPNVGVEEQNAEAIYEYIRTL